MTLAEERATPPLDEVVRDSFSEEMALSLILEGVHHTKRQGKKVLVEVIPRAKTLEW